MLIWINNIWIEQYAKTQLLNVKNSLLELEKDFIELRDRK